MMPILYYLTYYSVRDIKKADKTDPVTELFKQQALIDELLKKNGIKDTIGLDFSTLRKYRPRHITHCDLYSI